MTKKKSTTWPRLVTSGSVVVKVYQVKQASTRTGKAYTLSWHTPAGRKIQKFASLEDAMLEARVKADSIAAGRADAAEMSSTDREELAAARRAAGNTPLLSAIAEWVRARELVGAEIIPACESWASRNGTNLERITVAVAAKRFLAAKKKAGVDVACSYNKILPSLVEIFGEQAIGTITARELGAWMEERYPHPLSRNTARKRIVALWRWCRDQHFLPRDAKTEAEFTTTARVEDSEIGTIDHRLLSRLLHHFRDEHPEYLAPLAVAAFCGLRRAEVHAQDWQDVNLEAGHVKVTKAKRNTPSRRLVPLSDGARAWLMLCPNRKGRLCHNAAIDRIRDIIRTAKDADGESLFPPIPDNAFRHSFISHRVAQTGNVAETSLEAGNSPKIVHAHYRALFPKADGEAWFSLTPASSAGEVVQLREAAHA